MVRHRSAPRVIGLALVMLLSAPALAVGACTDTRTLHCGSLTYRRHHIRHVSISPTSAYSCGQARAVVKAWIRKGARSADVYDPYNGYRWFFTRKPSRAFAYRDDLCSLLTLRL
jgi:hypothetical protein